MRIIITGTPGTGKTAIAEILGRKIKHKALNEKDFCGKKRIGKIDKKTKELVVPLGKLEKELNRVLKKEKNIIIEGHLLCECRLRPADFIFVIRLSPDRLEFRLRERNYPEAKIQDNVLCEGIDYCRKHAQKNYAKGKIFEISNNGEIKKTISEVSRIIKTPQNTN